MTYPAESVQYGCQNHVEDIRSFLDGRHADHYTVFNLSQRNYRGAKFSNRVSVIVSQDAAHEDHHVGFCLCSYWHNFHFFY